MAKNKHRKVARLQPLKPGDIVDVIAPGSACPEDHLLKAVRWLEKQGLVPRYDQDILKPQKFLAQTDEYRFAQLKKALLDPTSKAVWCLRGGYGSFRLWPQLLKLKKPKQEKLLIGLSDITSLHQFLNQHWNWSSLHASLLDRIGQGKLPVETEKELMNTITGIQVKSEHFDLKPLNKYALSNKKIKSVLRGGNLTTFVSSVGTPMQLKVKVSTPVVLFFEDIGERGYKVDRFLNHLKLAGVFQNIKAVVFGDFTDGLEANGRDLVPETLADFARGLKIPVFAGIQSGHADIQRPLFFNTPITLTCGASPTMVIYSPYET